MTRQNGFCDSCGTSLLQRRLAGGLVWCPKCGTIRDGQDKYVPLNVEILDHINRKIAHGCTDGLCDECDLEGG